MCVYILYIVVHQNVTEHYIITINEWDVLTRYFVIYIVGI
jgi:hypothetical protein